MSFDPPLPGVLIDPNGQEPVVNITNAAGTAATAFVDTFAVTPLTFPITVTARTTIFLAGEGPWTVSAKVNGIELAGQVMGLEGNQVGTVTLPAPLTTGQLATLTAESQQIINNYNISGSLATYTGSGASGQKVLTIGAGHDFQVGHGIRVIGAGNLTDSNVIAAPTVAAVGTPGGATYQYQVSACLSLSSQADCMSVASAATSINNGNASLSTTNYNTIQWTPGSTEQGFAIYGRTSGSMQLLGYSWYMPGVHASLTVPTSNQPPFIGANLSPSTSYTYAFTGVDFQGNETPTLHWANGFFQNTASTSTTVFGIILSWDYIGGAMMAYRYYNIYRATGAGALQFLAQVNTSDEVYADYGLTAPNAGQNPPTVMTFRDTGQSAITGTAARPPHIPTIPPASGTSSSLYTSVAAVTPTTVTLTAALSTAVSGAAVYHDDSTGINNALTALGTVTLPNNVYPIHRRVTVPTGGTLQGLAWPSPATISVTSTTNPTPNPNSAVLAFYALQGQQQVTLGGVGSSIQKMTWFWPNQANGNHATQQFIPYPASVYGNFGGSWQLIDRIYDANSWVGVQGEADSFIVKNFWCGFIRFQVWCRNGESLFDTFKSDPNIYAGSINLVAPADRTVIRGASNANLPTISNLAVDDCTPVWWTTGNSSSAGGGQIGGNIQNVWCDDFSPSLVLDSPVSDTWTSGGQVFGWRVSNYFAMAGSGSPQVTTGLTTMASGGNDNRVQFSNCYFAGTLTLKGQMYFSATNLVSGGITFTPSSPWATTPTIQASISSLTMTGTTRFTTTAGATKVHLAGTMNTLANNGMADVVSGGTLYVLDEQVMMTERFHIPTGTVLSLGDNTIGHIVLPAGNGNNYLYVVSVAATGSSATDVWKVNGTAIVTTSAALSAGLRNGAAGEGHGGVAVPLLTALYTLSNTNGSGCTVLPVVLNAAAGVTTSAPLEARITYCITPVNS